MVWEVGIWFEGEMRGRGVYRVQTVSRVRIVMWGRGEGWFEGEIRWRGR